MRQIVLAVGLLVLVAGCGGRHGMYRHGGGNGYAGDRGGQEVMALVDRTVQDQEKAKQVKAVVTDMMEEVKQSFKQSREYHKQLYELNAKYEATPEEFTKILDDLNNSRMRTGAKILGLRFKMRELMTEQEWKSLSEGLNEMRGRYRQRAEAPGASATGY